MKKILIVFVMLYLTPLNPLHGGEDEWSSIQGPPGGYSKAVDFHPEGTIIYASSDSFLYISTDNGLSWQITDHLQKEFCDIKIGEYNSGYYVFTATTDGIYRGFNGAGWQKVYRYYCEQIVLDRDSISYIYAIATTAEGTNVIRSTDQGASWVSIQEPGSWWSIEIDPFDPTTIYAGHYSDGLWVSYDAGENWDLIGPDNGNYFINKKIWDIDVSPRSANVIFVVVNYLEMHPPSHVGEVWKSTDGGNNWHKVLFSHNSEILRHVVISHPSPDTVFAVMVEHSRRAPIRYSYEEGDSSTWQPFQPHLDWPHLAVWEICSAPSTDGLFLIAAADGLARSTDFLNPYRFSYTGLKPRYPTNILSVNRINENFVICDADASVFPPTASTYLWKTTDDGSHWQVYPELIYENEGPLEPKQIRIINQNKVYLIGRHTLPLPSWNGFFISEDGGESYDDVFSWGTDILVQFDVFNENTVYLIANDWHGCHLWRSEYPFTTWDERSVALPSKYCLKIHPLNPDTLFLGGRDGGFWKSFDGGQNLIPANSGLPTLNNVVSSIVTGFSTSEQPVILFCGFKKHLSSYPGSVGIYKSTDMGENWEFANLDEEINELKVDPLDPSIIYAATPNGMYVSHDYGAHWITLNNGLEEVANKCFAVDLSTARPHLFCGTPHGVFKFSPIGLFSGTPKTTAYQSKKIIIKNDEMWLTYQTAGGIYFSTSDLVGQSKIREFGVKDGEFPTIDLDADENPCAVWQHNIETPTEKGGELWFSRYDGADWSEPYRLVSFVDEDGVDVNPPAFVIDPRSNVGYVTFEERGDTWMNGPISRLYLGWFPINNPADTHFIQLYYAESPIRCEFPSISLSSDYLYIAFQKEHKIYRIRRNIDTGDTIWLQISEDERFSHHPYVDVEANGRVNYVWEDSTADNIEIWWAYEYRERFYPQGNVSVTPGTSQWPQICKGTTYITWSEYFYPPTNHNWDILYKDLEYPGYYNLSQTLAMSKYSYGIITQPPSSEPRLTGIWTEGNQSPYEIYAKTVLVNPEPTYYYVNAGQEEPSPWTIQREGYLQFASEPEKTIDYHAQKLIYHFPNLNSAKRYRIKLVFYFESQNPDNWKMKVNADNIFHANTWLTPGEITILERWLPTACYMDGEIYLEIEKEAGDYALIAQIMIYEYEQESEGGAQSAQEFVTSETEEFGVFIRPNPCHAQAIFHYSIHPNNERSVAGLKIYDATGRLVRQFDHTTIRLSNQIYWDGTDENGRILSSGIYFVVLEYGGERLNEKLILIR